MQAAPIAAPAPAAAKTECTPEEIWDIQQLFLSLTAIQCHKDDGADQYMVHYCAPTQGKRESGSGDCVPAKDVRDGVQIPAHITCVSGLDT